MSKNHHQAISCVLRRPKEQLTRIVDQVGRLQKLQKAFELICDEELSAHCQIASFEKGKLNIIADSSAWATRLRFAEPELKKALKQAPEFKGLKSIRSMIQLNYKKSEPKIQHRQMKISDRNTKMICDIANGIQDPKLKAALLKLSGYRRQ